MTFGRLSLKGQYFTKISDEIIKPKATKKENWKLISFIKSGFLINIKKAAKENVPKVLASLPELYKENIDINQLLNDLVYKLELSPIAPPNIIPYYYGKVKEDIGISAILLLEGGHVTIHTFPKRECYFIDCFTPDDFDENML